MKKQNIKSKKGFTIIEVVLVLAIAGLIFLMVFVALPALQRSQRDSQRRQDYSNLQAAVISAAANHDGRVTESGLSRFSMNKDGQDPDGTNYNINLDEENIPNQPDFGEVYVNVGRECGEVSGTPESNEDTPSTSFTVYARLESGTYCQTGSLR